MTAASSCTSASARAGVSRTSQSLRVPTGRHSSGRNGISDTAARIRSAYIRATVVR